LKVSLAFEAGAKTDFNRLEAEQAIC
jgi:hypothetical protein